MLTLADELDHARRELDTWARLHDADLSVFRALVVVSKAVAALRRQEPNTT